MDLKYIVYITVNLCNGKIYVGVHKTNPEVFDGYVGDGIYRANLATGNQTFHKAVRKYGYENFRRTTIKVFPYTEEGRQAAFALEAAIVSKDFLNSKNVYNMIPGGEFGVAPDKKRVYQFDLKGNYLRSFECAMDAALALRYENTISVYKGIRNVCLGARNSCKGYYWSYKKEFKYKSEKAQPVAQYTLSGKFLRHFDSLAEAEYELSLNSIRQAIVRRYKCGDWQWRFFSGDTNDIAPLINNLTKNDMIPISMYDKEGNFIKAYNSVKECTSENPNFTASQINRCLKHIIKSHKGYIFKYQDEDMV